jgi:hypothetical protein
MADDHDALVALSVRLEDETGYDSIPTIEMGYSGKPGVYLCPFPDCEFAHRNAVEMWKHYHFSAKHGLSFGRSLATLVDGGGDD